MNEMPMSNANALAGMMVNNALGSGFAQRDHLNKVSGIEGMNLFQTKPNSEYALFEESSDVFCVKSTDGSNNATTRYFAFKEITKEEAMQEISPYLMKGELDTFKENMLEAIRGELGTFKEEILNAQQSVRNNASNGGYSYETARLVSEQTNQINLNLMNQTNILSQQLQALGARMDSCCCEIKTQMLQDRLDEAERRNVTLQGAIDNANQSQYLLGQLGRFVAWAGSGTQATTGT